MKMKSNVILRSMQARIQQLKSHFMESESIQHSSTKGSLREAYLKQFISHTVPIRYKVNTGFITDSASSEISPQIDLVVYDTQDLPALTMSDFVTIVPIESAQCVIEVKSTLQAAHFDQLAEQQSAFRRMRFATTTSRRELLDTVDCLAIPSIGFAYETGCSLATLKEWFSKEAGLFAICIFDRYFIVRDLLHGTIEVVESDGKGCELLHLICLVNSLCVLSREERADYHAKRHPGLRFYADLGCYLVHDVPNETERR
jgi:hypothetical protein